ncbi:MAG: hypothetical protein O0X49_06170, partial [Methanocorpusculum sp.]|nr:hypothetical protein [Methanocorpusculum sp.]
VTIRRNPETKQLSLFRKKSPALLFPCTNPRLSFVQYHPAPLPHIRYAAIDILNNTILLNEQS